YTIDIFIYTHVTFSHLLFSSIFFVNDPPTTLIYTLSLHDALPISCIRHLPGAPVVRAGAGRKNIQAEVRPPRFESSGKESANRTDRKSTRLNSSHGSISYAVFCLKKKKKKQNTNIKT